MGNSLARTKYRLLAVDVDGTLAAPGQPVPQKVIARLKDCAQMGISVVLATGKQFLNIRSLWANIGTRSPAITCNGAVVVDGVTGSILFGQFVPVSSYVKLAKKLQDDERLSTALFTAKDIICTQKHFASRCLAAIGEQTTRFVPSLIPAPAANIAKILVAARDVDTLYQVYRDYERQFADRFSVAVTSETFVEFMAPGVSKGEALKAVAAREQIPLQKIACVGDSDNDLSMFAIAGLRVAVGNATDRVLAAADVRVPSAADAGVVVAIDSWILESTQ